MTVVLTCSRNHGASQRRPAKAGFTAEGAGNFGVVNLLDAAISGRLELSEAKLSNPNGSALQAPSQYNSADGRRKRLYAAILGRRDLIRVGE
jgi:hypothetical protein